MRINHYASNTNSVTVCTFANIALCKYWGKRNQELMLPTKSSISLSLAALKTTSSVSLCDGLHDIIILNGKDASEKDARPIKLFFDTCRKLYSLEGKIQLISHNNFAHSAGMASSASGFSALAIALNELYTLGLTKQELTILSRRGSGSACRSLYGGFVYWQKGIRDDGLDCIAQQIAAATHWPELRIISVVISSQPKSVSSRDGMLVSMNTSSYYSSWIKQSEATIPLFIEAITRKDLNKLGLLTEAEWQAWQQVLHTTIPSLSYLNLSSTAVITAIEKLRSSGVACYFTTDAGPNIHILCEEKNIAIIRTTLHTIPDIQELIVSQLADDPMIIELL
jgi:diphosphomevalonate decarboxylase